MAVKQKRNIEVRVGLKQGHIFQIKSGDERAHDFEVRLVGARRLDGGDSKAVGVHDIHSAGRGKGAGSGDLLSKELFQRVHCSSQPAGREKQGKCTKVEKSKLKNEIK